MGTQHGLLGSSTGASEEGHLPTVSQRPFGTGRPGPRLEGVLVYPMSAYSLLEPKSAQEQPLTTTFIFQAYS